MLCPKCNRAFAADRQVCPVDGAVLVHGPEPDAAESSAWQGETLSQEGAAGGAARPPGAHTLAGGTAAAASRARISTPPVIARNRPSGQSHPRVATAREPSAPAVVRPPSTGPGVAVSTGAGAQLDAELAAGTMVGEYQVQSLLGTGGMGSVYAGVQPVIGKRVAIKVLLRELAANPQVLHRFIQEARAVNQAHSRHIVDIFSFGELPDGRQYFVMEQLEGKPLREFLKQRQTLRFEEAHGILSCVCKGLIAAHSKGIVHRDIKPENIMVKEEEDHSLSAKILDFGIAKLQGGDSSHPGFSTRTGAAMGTPYYMSPEQCRGIGVDHRTDIYALGIIMFEIFTGALPFTARSYIDLVNKHLFASPPPPSKLKDTISKPLETLILRCIAKDPSERPQSVEQLLDELTQLGPSLRGTSFTLTPIKADGDAPFVPPTAGEPATGAARRRRSPAIWLAPLAVLLLCGAAGAYYLGVLRTATPQAGSAPPPTQAVGLATLRIETRPPGARVFLDGKEQGERSPLVARVRPGSLQLRVELDGYEPASEIVTLVAARELAQSYSLRPRSPAVAAPAGLVLKTGLARATYFLDGRIVGQGAELELMELKPGVHQLRITAPGHLPLEQSVSLESGRSATLALSLRRAGVKDRKGRGGTEDKAVKSGSGTTEDPDDTLDPFRRRKQQ
jgi:serine/threonine-protein kinase